MKNIKGFASLLSALMLVLLLPGCSGNSSDSIRELLSTVPDEASMVTAIDIKKAIEDNGGKIDGDKVTLPEEAQKKIKQLSAGQQKELQTVLDGNSGILMEGVVAFMTDRLYITGLLADAKKFQSWAETNLKENFDEEGDFKVSKGLAFNGKQFWMTLESSIDADRLDAMTRLKESESWLSNKYSEQLIENKDFIRGTVSMPGIMTFMRNEQALQLNLALNILFKDARNLAFSAGMDKEKIVITGEVLNEKFEESKFLLPVSKLSKDDINALESHGQIIAAINLSSSLMEKIDKAAQSFGGNLPPQLLSLFSSLDGPAVIATDAQQNAIEGYLTLAKKGADTEALMQSLKSSGMTNVNVDGSRLRFYQGNPPTGISTGEAAPAFNGAMAGVYFTGDFTSHFIKGSKSASLMFMPQGDKIKLVYTINL